MSARERLAYGILRSQHPGVDSEEIYLDVKGDAAQSDADDSHCDQGPRSKKLRASSSSAAALRQHYAHADYLHLAHCCAALA